MERLFLGKKIASNKLANSFFMLMLLLIFYGKYDYILSKSIEKCMAVIIRTCSTNYSNLHCKLYCCVLLTAKLIFTLTVLY